MVYLDPNQVPNVLKQGYNGHKFKAEAVTELTIGNHEGYWDGGSRNNYHVIRTSDSARLSLSNRNMVHPGRQQPGEITYSVKPGYVIVEHSIFCGKDMGLTFYVHPNDIAPMLPTPALINQNEEFVLKATQCLKASYAGKSRCQNAIEYPSDVHWKFRDLKMTNDNWEAVKANLIERKMLNKVGAITIKGKNALQA